MKRLILATLSFALAWPQAVYAAHQSPLPSMPPTPSVEQTQLLSEAQAGLSAWDLTAYAAHPAELRTETAQHFIDEAFARFEELSPVIKLSELHEIRTALRAEDPTQDLGLPEKVRAFTEDLTKSKTGDRLGAWLIGILTGEIEENANNEKNRDLSEQEIHAIIPLNALDGLFPAMHDLRLSFLTLRLFNPKVPDWQRLGITAHTMRQIIGAAPTKDQTPIAGLVAMNIPEDKTHLIDTGTALIEFINADGSFKTMTTYTDDKSINAAKNIHCATTPGSTSPGLFLLPLSISPIGKDIAESSFQGLVSSCEKIDGLQPAMTYQSGLITPFSTMIGLILMTDPTDGKIIMQHIEHGNELHRSAQTFIVRQ